MILKVFLNFKQSIQQAFQSMIDHLGVLLVMLSLLLIPVPVALLKSNQGPMLMHRSGLIF